MRRIRPSAEGAADRRSPERTGGGEGPRVPRPVNAPTSGGRSAPPGGAGTERRGMGDIRTLTGAAGEIADPARTLASPRGRDQGPIDPPGEPVASIDRATSGSITRFSARRSGAPSRSSGPGTARARTVPGTRAAARSSRSRSTAREGGSRPTRPRCGCGSTIPSPRSGGEACAGPVPAREVGGPGPGAPFRRPGCARSRSPGRRQGRGTRGGSPPPTPARSGRRSIRGGPARCRGRRRGPGPCPLLRAWS